MLKMALERLKQLSAHEVGHTLGLMHNYASSVNDRASVMDYPDPLIRLTADGAIDLSRAYDNKIGAWDKIAINWGYRQYNKGQDEHNELDKIMDDAAANGMLFISDRDARAHRRTSSRCTFMGQRQGRNRRIERNDQSEAKGTATIW
jgi:hypothetical protein